MPEGRQLRSTGGNMRVVHLVSGAGQMYCGSCMHANALVTALQSAGHEALLVPAYTPVRTDDDSVSVDHIVFGGLNVYLQQKVGLFRRTPWALDRLLDRPWLLRWLGRLGTSTRPESLGELTVSMLRGEEGRQGKELEKLLCWLKDDLRPEVVHLSNVLLAGMAREIARELRVPVVCSLSGEDIFLERLVEPYYSQACEALRDRCRDLDALVAMNGYFADFMSQYLAVERERIRVIRPGLNMDGYGMRPAGSNDGEFVIGFLGRICPEKGLHLLAEAFTHLAEETDLGPLRLVAAGYLPPAGKAYLEEIRGMLGQFGLAGRFEYRGELDRAGKIAFLKSLDLMSLPTVYRESKGLPVLEAWACGVPAVLPSHGAFPEMVADCGAGLLCTPQDPRSLADCMKELILDRERTRELGRAGHAAVHERYGIRREAEETARLYEELRFNDQ